MKRTVEIKFNVDATICQTIELNDGETISDKDLIDSLNGCGPRKITTTLSSDSMELKDWDDGGKTIGIIKSTETDYNSDNSYRDYEIDEE